MIDIDNVSWTYPHAAEPSLRDVNITIRAGEFVVLCGASGSGKSTALRLMNGLVPHFYDNSTLRGHVTVAGRDTAEAELDEIGLLTGTVLQHPHRQFFTDTVAEELAFAMENFGFPRDDIRAHVDVQLAELAGSVPLTTDLAVLSGGQQQQVAIAAAGTHRPGIMLLDEPSSNLSADAIDRLGENLRTLKHRGVTLVIAEHRVRYLEDLLDRVVFFADSRIETEWTAQQFRSITDDTLARYGLRGTTQDVHLPSLPASGPSITGSVPADLVPDGALELTDVTCRAGGRLILSIDRLTFPAGSVTAIRGNNGAGKSTLSRVIAGLRSATGTIRYHGTVLGRRARQRATTLVMQDVQRQLFTETVAAEMALAQFGGSEMGDTRMPLDALDLGHLTTRHPLSLSSGQQQRLVVAGARVANRPIVIFDEPSSGVDRRHLTSISDQIRHVAATGAVVMLISHDDDLLNHAADQHVTLMPPAERPG
ncbi:MAG: ATP-binding cassette domain-containing protein [Dermatophilaceae bacterium]